MKVRVWGARLPATLSLVAATQLAIIPGLDGQVHSADSVLAQGVGSNAIQEPRFADRWLLVGAVVGSAALFTLDDDFRDWFTDPALQNSGSADFVARGASHLGGWGPLAASGGLFVLGTLAGSEDVSDPALHVFGGILSATVATTVIKGVFGRTRPSDSEYPIHEFGFGRGFRDGHPFRSFPSGHTTTAFAMASALSAEASHRWPQAYPYVKWSAYSLATITGLSRMYDNKHWASDVFLGAGIGLVVGRAFVRWRHSGDGVGSGVSVSPGPAAGSVSVNLRLPIG